MHLDSAGVRFITIIGSSKYLYLFTQRLGFCSEIYPGVSIQKCAESTQSSLLKFMLTSNISGSKGKHGGARSVLCWEEKLALMDEHVITEFLSQVNCDCNCNCSDKIRDLGNACAVKMIHLVLFSVVNITFTRSCRIFTF